MAEGEAMRRVKRFRATLLALAILSAMLGMANSNCQAAKRTTLEGQLHVHSPRILEELRKRGCRNVGVLKFRVQIADGPASDNAGPLNSLAAERLEAALALANPRRPGEQFVLVRNASSVAAKIPGASHLKASGIPRLFSGHFPAAWGNQEVQVDAFVTGVIQVAADLRTMRVGILVVRPQAPLVDLLMQFPVDTDGALLNEIGASFQRRGIGDADEPDPATLARQVRRDPRTHFPLRNEPAVALRIYYDRQPVELAFVEGEAMIPEPREGQHVTMTLERMDQDNRVLGAVLKVNGESTLYRQRQRDFDCGKWVLKFGKPITIPGYQISEERVEQFRVAAPSESPALEMDYGPDVGTISLVVFQEAIAPSPPPLDDEALDLLAIAKAGFPDEPPRSAEALQATVRASVGESGTRGIIAPGSETDRKIEIVKHQWDSEPVMSAVIRYYRPRN